MFEPPTEDETKKIFDMSHNINDYDPIHIEASENKHNNTPKTSRARTPPPALSTPLPPPPRASATAAKIQADTVNKINKTVNKQIQEKKENEESRRREKLIDHIKQFLMLGIKRKIIEPEELEDFKYKANKYSLPELEQKLDNIKKALTRAQRKEMIFNGIGMVISTGEGVAVNMMDKHEFKGISKAFPMIRPEIEDEIDEIAIEYGDNLVPNVWVRLGYKLANFVYGYQLAMGVNVSKNQEKPSSTSTPQ